MKRSTCRGGGPVFPGKEFQEKLKTEEEEGKEVVDWAVKFQKGEKRGGTARDI